MKLAERKLTTKQGVEELRAFLKSFNFQSDVKQVTTEKKFFARIDTETEGQRNEFRNCQCQFAIINGNLEINAFPIDYNSDYCIEGLPFDQAIKRIEFLNCIESFFDVVQKYNEEVVKKEEEIEKFLNFVSEYKKMK
jgi:hypothetical protein